jgi:hypothetical protein
LTGVSRSVGCLVTACPLATLQAVYQSHKPLVAGSCTSNPNQTIHSSIP